MISYGLESKYTEKSRLHCYIPTLTVLGSNPELRNEKPMTNCPSIALVFLFTKAEVEGGGGKKEES